MKRDLRIPNTPRFSGEVTVVIVLSTEIHWEAEMSEEIGETEMYELVKRLYEDALDAVKQWKHDHENFSFSDPELCLLQEDVVDATRLLNDAEQRWKEAVEAHDMLKASYDLLQLVLPCVLINAPTTLSICKQDFKHILCEFYARYHREQHSIQCMVLDIPFPKSVVTAVHLFLRRNEHLAATLMQIQDIDDPRNGMLMFKPVEYAFNHCQLSFIRDYDDSFKLKLFDVSIRDTKLIDYITDPYQRQVVIDAVLVVDLKNRCKFNLETTFGQLDGKNIHFHTIQRPFYRCLNLQARLAHRLALQQGWIDDSFQFNDFWSDGSDSSFKMNKILQSMFNNS
jgi:HNH endonuclease